MYACVNAVNDDHNTTGDAPTGKLTLTLNPVAASVSALPESIKIKAYPNPVAAQLYLELDNAFGGTYTVRIADVNGRVMHTDLITVDGAMSRFAVSSSHWPVGLYFVQIAKDNSQRTITVVKG